MYVGDIVHVFKCTRANWRDWIKIFTLGLIKLFVLVIVQALFIYKGKGELLLRNNLYYTQVYNGTTCISHKLTTEHNQHANKLT